MALIGRDAGTGVGATGSLARAVYVALIVSAAWLAIQTFGPLTVGEHARRTFLEALQEHYPELQISIRRGSYEPGVGLSFEAIRIAEPTTTFGRARPMLRVERLTVVGDLDPQRWADGDGPFVANRVVVEGAEGDAWVRPDGSLSLTRLWPPPKLGPVCPRVDFLRSRLRLHAADGQGRPITTEITKASLLSREGKPGGGGAVRSFVLTGTTDFAGSLKVEARIAGGETEARVSLSAVHLSDAWLRRLPHRWCPRLDQFRELECIGDVTGSVRIRDGEPCDYRFRCRVDRGRIRHDRLPLPLSGIRGLATVTPGGITIDPTQMSFGEAVVRLQGQLGGTRWPCDLDLRVETSGLMLDEPLAGALPERLRRTWDRLRPHGRVDLDGSLRHRDGRWEPDGTLVCKGVDVRFDKFPYPVTDLSGRVEVEGGWVGCEGMHGRIGSSLLRTAFRLPVDPKGNGESSFVFEGDGAIPIDETLIEALTPRGETETKLAAFVRSLRPGGSVRLASAVIRKDAAGRPRRRVELEIVNGHLRYERFAYPLFNVNGTIRVTDHRMDLVDFRGTNANAGTIRCHGTYLMPVQDAPAKRAGAGKAGTAAGLSALSATTPRPASALTMPIVNGAALPELQLVFRAANVSMDDALRSSLPAPTRHVWDAVSPSGMLDDLTVSMIRVDGGSDLTLDVHAVQHDTPHVTNRTLSLRPVAIPYRLDITGGSVHYDGDRVVIRSVSGRHDASHVAADGECVPTADGRWALSLDIHGGSRLVPDAELIEALPEEMEEAIRRLQIRDPLSVRGSTRILLSDERHPEPTIDWDLLLQLEGNRIGDVGPVHSLRGELSIQGRHDEQALTAAGEVRIDSMHVYGLQIMGVRGPFTIVDDQLTLGTFRERVSSIASDATLTDVPTVSPRTIRGRVFDGILDLEGLMTLSSGDFDVRLAIREARVPTLLADLGHADRELMGTFAGQAHLEGRLGAPELLTGSGVASLSGTNLYKLPLLVQVLNQLRITPTEDVAFTDGDVEFTIDDDQLQFRQLQLWGALVALHGYGTLNRRGDLDLTFNTRVSPQNVFTRAMGPLRHSRYTLWTIDVRGPFDNPTIERRALDGVGQTLERLFPGLAPEVAKRGE